MSDDPDFEYLIVPTNMRRARKKGGLEIEPRPSQDRIRRSAARVAA